MILVIFLVVIFKVLYNDQLQATQNKSEKSKKQATTVL